MSNTITDGISELYNYAETKAKTDAAQTTINIADVFSIPKPIENRVFINHVDDFCAKHISTFLTDQIRGAAKAGEGGGEGEEEEDETAKPSEFAALKYEVIGTLKHSHHRKPEDVLHIVNETDVDFLNEIMQCAFVVYDITEDRAQISKALDTLTKMEGEIEKLKEVGPKTFKDYAELRVFVLISTVMTWGLTKPIDPEEPETPFNETDYKKRKPHPNYKEHIACEREVILKGKKYKNKLRTFVVCSGIVYGEEEEDLSFFFKLAWKNEEFLPVFQPGNNFIPLIHIADLCRVLHGILEIVPKKPQYILAVEQTPCTLKQIIKALSKALGQGRTKETSKEEAFLYCDMTQTVFERCTVNLNMAPGFIVDDLELEWKNELNLAENMANVAAEFRTSRKLVPIRVVIHGPPSVGKTGLALKLCEIYGAQHVTVKNMIENTLKDMRETIEAEKARQKLKEDKVEEEAAEEEGADEVDIEDLAGQIRDIESSRSASENGKLPDDHVIRLLKRYLSSNRCQNQGYVLDGYPKTFAQAKELFGESSGVGEEEAEEEEEPADGASKILPDHVISLQATDEFLCERLMKLPEREIQGTNYTEENILRRLSEFRRVNTEDNTVLNFFDEIEIHPIVIDAMENADAILTYAIERLGPVMGLAPSLEEEAEMLRCEEDLRRLEEEQDALEKERLEILAVERYQNEMEEWAGALERLQAEEEKLMVAESEPLRNYLMKFVFPVLTKGLLEVARIKPRDPVDFLAEYLFKENPEGRMFDPSYTKQGEVIVMQDQNNEDDAH